MTVPGLGSAMDKAPAMRSGGTWIEPRAARPICVVLFCITEGAARRPFTSAICGTDGKLITAKSPVFGLSRKVRFSDGGCYFRTEGKGPISGPRVPKKYQISESTLKVLISGKKDPGRTHAS